MVDLNGFVTQWVMGRCACCAEVACAAASEQGHGIAVLSPPIARPSLDAGAIRQVLSDWSFPPMPVHAVMTSRLMPARVRAFVDFLASRLIVL